MFHNNWRLITLFAIFFCVLRPSRFSSSSSPARPGYSGGRTGRGSSSWAAPGSARSGWRSWWRSSSPLCDTVTCPCAAGTWHSIEVMSMSVEYEPSTNTKKVTRHYGFSLYLDIYLRITSQRKTSLPYFGVKLSFVCLMFAYREK